MGILDDSDSDDDSTSSEEVEDKKGGGTKTDVSKYMNAKRASLSDYEAFKGDADADANETAAKMKEILQLREALGMDKDVNFLAQQEAKEKEKQRLANLTVEERMKEDADSAGDMMARIRAKQEELAKKKAAEAEGGGEEAADDDDAAAKKKKKKEKKKKKDKA